MVRLSPDASDLSSRVNTNVGEAEECISLLDQTLQVSQQNNIANENAEKNQRGQFAARGDVAKAMALTEQAPQKAGATYGPKVHR
jgi:hypothetical protein